MDRGAWRATVHRMHSLMRLSTQAHSSSQRGEGTYVHLGPTRHSLRRRQWHPTPVFLPRKSHGQRSLVGYSPWGHEESDTTERLHFHFSLSRTGKGNGNPLQCSCLENPRDGGAWWAAIHGVALSWTRLKRLSSSSRHSRIQHESMAHVPETVDHGDHTQL